MSKKTTTDHTMAWTTPPATQATTNLQNMVGHGADFATPIRNAYARSEQSLNRSYNNPLGAFTTADVRDKSMRAQQQDLHQSMGMDLANAAQQNAQNTFSQQATVAGLTAPQAYNNHSVQSVSDPMGMIMGLGGAAANVGSAALM